MLMAVLLDLIHNRGGNYLPNSDLTLPNSSRGRKSAGCSVVRISLPGGIAAKTWGGMPLASCFLPFCKIQIPFCPSLYFGSLCHRTSSLWGNNTDTSFVCFFPLMT